MLFIYLYIINMNNNIKEKYNFKYSLLFIIFSLDFITFTI